MNSPVISIAWELLARKRWATALVALSFPVCYSINSLWPNVVWAAKNPETGGMEGGWFMPLEFITFLLAITTLFWLFSYAEPDRAGRQSGFPARMFPLPLRTVQLVAIPTMLGARPLRKLGWMDGKTAARFSRCQTWTNATVRFRCASAILVRMAAQGLDRGFSLCHAGDAEPGSVPTPLQSVAL